MVLVSILAVFAAMPAISSAAFEPVVNYGTGPGPSSSKPDTGTDTAAETGGVAKSTKITKASKKRKSTGALAKKKCKKFKKNKTKFKRCQKKSRKR